MRFLRFVGILRLFVGDLRLLPRKTANKTPRDDDVGRVYRILSTILFYTAL